MIIAGKNQKSLSTEEVDKVINKKFISNEIKTNSNLKQTKEHEENNSSNCSEENDSLKYDSSYKAVISDNQKNVLRKSSTLSTNVSQSETGLDNSSPQKSCKDCLDCSPLNFGRERFASTPISNYYDGTDNYFKGLHPEKNDYQKSNNYLEKKIFFRDHFPSVDLNLIYKEKQKRILFEENQSTIPPVMPNPQTPKTLGKIEFPIYILGYCGIDCK